MNRAKYERIGVSNYCSRSSSKPKSTPKDHRKRGWFLGYPYAVLYPQRQGTKGGDERRQKMGWPLLSQNREKYLMLVCLIHMVYVCIFSYTFMGKEEIYRPNLISPKCSHEVSAVENHRRYVQKGEGIVRSKRSFLSSPHVHPPGCPLRRPS